MGRRTYLALLHYTFVLELSVTTVIRSHATSVSGCLGLLTRQAMSVSVSEFSQCYDDVNICLWTNDSPATHSEAQTSCQRRNSILVSVTDRSIEAKLAEVRSALPYLTSALIWSDMRAVSIDGFHWIDSSSLAG